jgi:hypothetical protein
MQKKLFVLFLSVAMIVGMTAIASADQRVTNTAQKGSLLIYPKIDISDARDTIVMITNDMTQGIDVKCYWVDSYQNWQDFSFYMTKKQPVWFSAKTGKGTYPVPPFVGKFTGNPQGELKCWAVSEDELNQISWNHLFGTAKIIDFGNETAYEYNSWNFTARGVPRGTAIGTKGELLLTGQPLDYDGCPKYLLFNFAADGTVIAGTGSPDKDVTVEDVDLTIVPCKEDLQQDRTPTYTKLQFTLWNEDEVKYTGAYQCVKCWWEDYVENIEYGSDKFLKENLHTDFGQFRVKGVESALCEYPIGEFPAGSTVDTGLVGLSAEILRFDGGALAVAGTTPNHAGLTDEDSHGFVLWDAEDTEPPEFR